MKANDLHFFKQTLLVQRSEILNKSDALPSTSPMESVGKGDEGDLASTEVSLSLSLRLRERQAHMLQQIDHALSKIDVGSFGLCEQCEETLNINRLRARPVATLCIACKEEQESRSRVYA